MDWVLVLQKGSNRWSAVIILIIILRAEEEHKQLLMFLKYAIWQWYLGIC